MFFSPPAMHRVWCSAKSAEMWDAHPSFIYAKVATFWQSLNQSKSCICLRLENRTSKTRFFAALDFLLRGVGWWRILHLHTCEMLRNWWGGEGVGWGWWRILHLHTCEMLRNWWGGGGWGGDDDVSCTCIHVRCYATDGVGTQSSKNKDLMLWMRCWQWRYEHGSDNLLKETGHKLNNLWALQKDWETSCGDPSSKSTPPISGITQYEKSKQFFSILSSILTIFSPLFWSNFALFDDTAKSTFVWKSPWICNMSKWKAWKRSRGFQSAGMYVIHIFSYTHYHHVRDFHGGENQPATSQRGVRCPRSHLVPTGRRPEDSYHHNIQKSIWARVDPLLVLGMGNLPPLIGNPYNGHINPYYWVDDHPLYSPIIWK